MVSLGHVALDGTKVQANASKQKAMSHERMLKAEAQLEKEIKELMRRAEILDAQEDRKYGKGKLGSDLPEELWPRQDRLEKTRQAREALETEAAAAAARDRAKQAAAAEAAAGDAAEAEADNGEQQKLRDKAAKAQEKAEAARSLTIEKAKEAANLYSWSVPAEQPYFYAAWLGELLLYLIHRIGGVELTTFTRTILAVITFWLVGVEARRSSGSWRIAAPVLALACLMSINNLIVRPQMGLASLCDHLQEPEPVRSRRKT